MKADGQEIQPPSEGVPPRGIERGRWIRPVQSEAGDASGGVRPVPKGEGKPESIASLLISETRERLSQLSRLEREIEDRVRDRWRAVEAEIGAREARLKEQLGVLAGEARLEAREARMRAQKEGRTEGFREGFEKGVEEGKRLGFEQGRIDGVREGRIVGRREEEIRFRDDARSALEALLAAAARLRDAKDRLLRDAQDGVVALAIQIAQKILDREIHVDPSAVLGPAGRAVDQVFRGCDVTLQIHPEDIGVVEAALREDSRWIDHRRSVKLEASDEVERGGCRLVSGGGVVDATIRSQLQLIEEALRGAEPPSNDEESD